MMLNEKGDRINNNTSLPPIQQNRPAVRTLLVSHCPFPLTLCALISTALFFTITREHAWPPVLNSVWCLPNHRMLCDASVSHVEPSENEQSFQRITKYCMNTKTLPTRLNHSLFLLLLPSFILFPQSYCGSSNYWYLNESFVTAAVYCLKSGLFCLWLSLLESIFIISVIDFRGFINSSCLNGMIPLAPNHSQ